MDANSSGCQAPILFLLSLLDINLCSINPANQSIKPKRGQRAIQTLPNTETKIKKMMEPYQNIALGTI